MQRTIRRLLSPCGIARGGEPLSPLISVLVLLQAAAAGHGGGDSLHTATHAFFGGASIGHQQGSFTGVVDINDLLGADRFHNAGLTGTNAVMANIEAGYPWNGHEALTHAQFIPTSGGVGEFDRHATWVSMLMGGRPGGADPGPHQKGLAPDAELHGGSIALSWPNNANFPRYSTSFSVNFFSNSTYGPYRAAFDAGITGPNNSRPADVINSSYNTNLSGAVTGTDRLSGVLDALSSQNPRTLMTVSVGNNVPSGAGPNRVNSAATAYNNMSVASLGNAATGYDTVSFFSNGGPNDYRDPLGDVPTARQVVDIAAPGENIATAYYGGETGGNGPNVFGPANGPAGGPDWYTRSVRGTSFSAPIVAGGAALLYDAAYARFSDNDDARDARVIKSILMNSADKISGWDNGQVPHPNNEGGVLTTQGLDDRVGAGRINLEKAFQQFLEGTTDVAGTAHGAMGQVEPIGWDFGDVADGTTNDYLIDGLLDKDSTFTGTLTWYRDRRPTGTSSFVEQSYDNLDLELWSVENELPLALISESKSLYNNSEHFSFTIPRTAQYMLRVRWTEERFDLVDDVDAEQYGLSWAGKVVPEPGALLMVLLSIPAITLTRARRD